MAITSSTRLGLTVWSSGDDPFGRAQMQADNTALENLAAAWRTGTTAARPSADAGSAARSFYYSTTDGVLYFTDGSAWRPLNALGAAGDAYTVVAGAVSTPQGVGTALARADHKHPISTATAVNISGSNSEGSSTALARADHTHALANGVVQAANLAVNAVDRSKINAASILKASNSLLTFDTTNGFSVNISNTFFEAVGNAVSVKAGAITPTELAGNIGKAKLATDIVKANGGIAFTTADGLSVNTSPTVGLSVNTLIVNTNSIGPTHLTTAVAGNGLTGGNGSALAVNVDNSTVEISGGALRVKNAGIDNAKLSSNAVTKSNINASSIVKASGAVLFNTSDGFSVNVDNDTIGITSNALAVRADSIGATEVDNEVYVRGTVTGFTGSTARIHISNGANPVGSAGDLLFKY